MANAAVEFETMTNFLLLFLISTSFHGVRIDLGEQTPGNSHKALVSQKPVAYRRQY
jgi:hypothetical protein